MKPARLRTSPRYERAAEKLSKDDRRRAEQALKRFIEDRAYPGLSFEAVRGHQDMFSIRASRAVRIMLRRDRDAEGTVYTAVNVGSHRVYRRR